MKILNTVDFTAPTITGGSDKQAAWAMDIIQGAIDKIERWAKADADLVSKMLAQFPGESYYTEYGKSHESMWLEIAKNYAAVVSGKEFTVQQIIENRDRFGWEAINNAVDYYKRRTGMLN